MPERHRLVERLWFAETPGWRAARAALGPAAAMFRGGVAGRNALFDLGMLPSHASAVPAISVGNLTVGGTGKTPLVAFLARRLIARGARPAIVSRGYGGDEVLVHRTLTPEAIHIADPDRVRGVARAAAGGASVALLDDAFQHRRLRRMADIVLVAAERTGGRARVLPAGPYREPPSALRRATLIVVTVRAGGTTEVDRALAWVRRHAPGKPTAVARLTLGDLVTGDRRAGLDRLSGESVLAIAAIGEPAAFSAQLAAAGARVEPASFPDHHAYTPADVRRLAGRGGAHQRVVCTLKDYVKIAAMWPADAPPLWYASQEVHIERGAESLDGLVAEAMTRPRS